VGIVETRSFSLAAKAEPSPPRGAQEGGTRARPPASNISVAASVLSAPAQPLEGAPAGIASG